MVWPAPRKSERVELVCTCHTTVLWRVPRMFLYSVRINQKLSCRYTPIVIIIIIRAPTVAPPVRPPPAVQPVTGEDHRDDNYDEQERVHGVMRELPSVPRAIPSVASFFEPSVRSLLPSSSAQSLDCVFVIAFVRGSAVERRTGDAARRRMAAHAAAPAKGGWHTGARGAASRRPRANAPVLLVPRVGVPHRLRRNPQSRGSAQGGQSWHTQPDRCRT